MSVHQHKDGRWFVRYGKDGKDLKKYFGRGDIAQAQAEAFSKELDEAKGKAETWGLTVKQVLEEYHAKHLVSATTAQSDFYRLDRIIVPRLGSLHVERITSQDLNNYVQARREDGRALSTIDRELDVLRSAFNWAMGQHPPLILRNPLLTYRIKKPQGAGLAPISAEEFNAILKHAPEHLIRGMLIQWYCGTRPGGEISRIRWSDVDLVNGEIRIVSARKGGPAVRYVPVHESLAAMLQSWRAEDEKLAEAAEAALTELPVVHYHLAPIVSLKTAWKGAKRRAGITRRLRLYDFRHAWFTNALRAGGDLKAVSEIGGHSRPDTTIITYQHVSRRQHREAVAMIPIVDLPASQKKKNPSTVPPAEGQRPKNFPIAAGRITRAK